MPAADMTRPTGPAISATTQPMVNTIQCGVGDQCDSADGDAGEGEQNGGPGGGR